MVVILPPIYHSLICRTGRWFFPTGRIQPVAKSLRPKRHGRGGTRCRDFGHWCKSRWWFQRFFIFTPTWGNDHIWLMFLYGLKPPTRNVWSFWRFYIYEGCSVKQYTTVTTYIVKFSRDFPFPSMAYCFLGIIQWPLVFWGFTCQLWRYSKQRSSLKMYILCFKFGAVN